MGPFDDGIKVVHLEPEYNAMSEGRRVSVNEVGMIVLVPGVELKNQLASAEQAVIEVAMAMLWKGVECEQLLIPLTACSNIAHRNQGLRVDSRSHRR